MNGWKYLQWLISITLDIFDLIKKLKVQTVSKTYKSQHNLYVCMKCTSLSTADLGRVLWGALATRVRVLSVTWPARGVWGTDLVSLPPIGAVVSLWAAGDGGRRVGPNYG